MTTDQAVARQAARENLQRELLRELERAHLIIRNALNLMTTDQVFAWGEKNAADGVDGTGVTRALEREAVIARVKGQAS